jgi:pantetheine-phosphate adenylyltransferase
MRLDDPYGTTVTDEAFEAIVVSRETEPVAREINAIRRNRGFRELDIITIDMVNADDGIPISSTRIRRGEIDPMGHIIKRIRGALRRRRE